MLLVLVVLLLCAIPAAAQKSFLQCGSLLDVKAGKLIQNAGIVVENGKISAAGPGVTAPAGARIIDLSGSTCMPGLVDAHVHLTSDATRKGYQTLGFSVPQMTVTGVRNARVTLKAGFTTVRNVGASGYSDVALRDGVERGDIDGPRMAVSGPSLGITGGHCDSNLLAPEFNHTSAGVADGPWAARRKVREVIKYGADVIKVCASGGVMSKGDEPGTPQYTVEEMTAIVEEAHKLGRKVAAHAHGAQSIKDAIRAGVDSVEHGSFIDDEGIRMAREKGTFLVFDIYNDDYILQQGEKVGMLPESIEKERKVGQIQRENFKRAWQAGVRMAFGSDAGVYPHGDNAKQFRYMVKYGMTPAEAVRAATYDAAELLGWQNRIGRIAPGFQADIVAVKGNPLEDIQVLEKIGFVMKEGRLYP